MTIGAVYLPGSALTGAVECSIPAKDSLCIGYGDGGAAPANFVLEDGQVADVGFLKLYLATEHVDWTNIAQASPFRIGRGYRPSAPKARILWDALMIPIVQQKLGKDTTRQVTVIEEIFKPAFEKTFNFQAEGKKSGSIYKERG